MDTATRFHLLITAARAFIGVAESDRLQKQFQDDLDEALALGGTLSRELHQTAIGEDSSSFSGVNWEAAWAAAQTSTAYIQCESTECRDQIVQIIIYAILRGLGHKKVKKEIGALLKRTTNPNDVEAWQGIKERAELIASSELGNAYVEAQLRHAKASGARYVQWIATQSEDTCPLCVSRHGQIYKIEDVIGTAHPSCKCGLSAVSSEAVEEKDSKLRDVLLNADYWRSSQERVRKEFQDANGLDEKTANEILKKALRDVTPYEQCRNPEVKETAMPAVWF
jgi:SPP1 gp7 family putative phage head morphogenesis protein